MKKIKTLFVLRFWASMKSAYKERKVMFECRLWSFHTFLLRSWIAPDFNGSENSVNAITLSNLSLSTLKGKLRERKEPIKKKQQLWS